MYWDKIVVRNVIKINVVHWYHTYIFHPVMDITELIIFQYFYRPVIINAIQLEVTFCDSFQHSKRSTDKYIKLPSKLGENTLELNSCIFNWPLQIHRKLMLSLILKCVTIIDPITR